MIYDRKSFGSAVSINEAGYIVISQPAGADGDVEVFLDPGEVDWLVARLTAAKADYSARQGGLESVKG